MNKKGQPRHGGWKRGKRRHPTLDDWPRIRSALDEAAKRRQMRLVARKIGVHHDTVGRWRKSIDMPSPKFIEPIVAALYALRLYRRKQT